MLLSSIKTFNIDGDDYLYCYTLGVTPYNNLMCDYQRFEGKYCFRLQGWRRYMCLQNIAYVRAD